jgi:hypothetical protein
VPESTTRKALRQKAIKRLYRSRYPVVSTVTTTSTLLDTVIDTALQSGALDQDYIRAYILLSSTVASSPPWGTVSRIVNMSANTTAQCIPDFHATLKTQATQEYELHYWFHPTQVNEVMEELIQKLEYTVWRPLSLLADSGFDATIGDNWEEVGDGAISADTTNVIHGTQSAKMTSVTAGDYIKHKTNLIVDHDEKLICSADVFLEVSGDQAQMILYDETNSANIDTATASTMGWTHLEFDAVVPASCEEVTLRLASVAGGDLASWDNASIISKDKLDYPSPAVAAYSWNVGNLFYIPTGLKVNDTTADEAFRARADGMKFWDFSKVIRDETAVSPYRVLLSGPPDRPLWLKCSVDFDSFGNSGTYATDDAVTTNAPVDLVVAQTVAKLLEMRAEWHEDRGELETADVLGKRAFRIRLREAEPQTRRYLNNRITIKGAL